MLYVSRKKNESVIINDRIKLKVIETHKNYVKLGFDFPPEDTILREEIYKKICESNQSALEKTSHILKHMIEEEREE